MSSFEDNSSNLEEERYTVKSSFYAYDEDFYRSESSYKYHDSLSITNNKNPLILWPPCDRCKVQNEAVSFTISNHFDFLGVYAANPECLRAIEVVAFVEWLQSYGLPGAVRSRASESAILVYIKNMICDKPEKFELQIRSNKIILIAGDYEGVLYGLEALKQVILHNGNVSYRNNMKALQLHSTMISDMPKISKRAITLSYNFQVRSTTTANRFQVPMLSTLRFNTVLLNMDIIDTDYQLIEPASHISTQIADFKEQANKYRIDIIPTVFVSSREQWQITWNVINTLKGTKVLVVFDESILDVPEAMKAVFTAVYKSSTTNIVYHAFHPSVKKGNLVDQILVSSEAHQFIAWDYDTLFPAALSVKPVVVVKEYVNSLSKTFKVYEGGNHTTPINFTAHTERDFTCPTFAMKYFIAWFAAFASYGSHVEAIVQSPLSLELVDVALQIVLKNYANSPPTLKSTMLMRYGFNKPPVDPSRSPMQGKNNLQPQEPSIETELALWSLTHYDDLKHGKIPSTEEALKSYRFYRSILHAANQKVSTSSFPISNYRWNVLSHCLFSTQTGSDVDHFLLVVDLLCVISRTIYLVSLSNQNNTSNTSGNKESEVDNKDPTNTAFAALSELQNPQHKRAAVYDNVDMSLPYTPVVYPKSMEIANLLTGVVQSNMLFRNFKSEEHVRIVEAFQCIEAKAGEIIIKQGDSGDYFYIVESGNLDVYMESCGIRIKVGRTLARGDYFGELALMYNTPRAATVVATTASTLWQIDRHTYRSIVTHHNKETSNGLLTLLSNVTILNKRLGDVLTHNQLNKVVSTLEVEHFEHDAMIIRQHQTGDYFYIISEGQVDVWQEKVDITTGQKVTLGEKVATLHKGSYFGELALLADDVRKASCVAVGKVQCLSLSRDDFIAMIGSWQDIVTDNDNNVAGGMRGQGKRGSTTAATTQINKNYEELSLNDLEQLNVLGTGGFGKVVVARNKLTLKLYAMKAQSKSHIVSMHMEDMILNEMRIMKRIDHPLISKLYGAMQDTKYIYIVLELLPGGEFFNLLQKTGRLSEDKARFVAASVVSAFEECHKHKIAYRDLKPENMVMDSRGYVKIVDFGLAKVVQDYTWTMCGTPDYLAPEIILNKGHNMAVDYWALGVLTFEMVYGWPPFYHDHPMKVYEKIVTGKVNYPNFFSKPLEDLISKLLVNNPSKRLGNMKGGIADVVKHKWFGSFDWQGLLNGSLATPFTPDMQGFNAALAAAERGEQPAMDSDNTADHQDSTWFPDLD